MSSQDRLPRQNATILQPLDVIELPSGTTAEEVSNAIDRFLCTDGSASGAQVYAVMVYDPNLLCDRPVIRIQVPVDLT